MQKTPKCKCGKQWPAAKQWPSVWDSASWKPEKKPKASRPPSKVLKALDELWGQIPSEAQLALQKAGFQKKQKEEVTSPEDPLVALLENHKDRLPEEVKAALNERQEGLKPTAKEQATNATNDLKLASSKLRELGHRKIQLQTKIDATKSTLAGLYEDMKLLLAELVEAEKKSSELTKAFHETVLQVPTEQAVPELDLREVMKTLGVDLSEEQNKRLHELQAEHGAKKRKFAQEALAAAGLPPGLSDSSQGQGLPSQQGLAGAPQQMQEW